MTGIQARGQYRLFLFGRFRLTKGDQGINLPTQKWQALLAFLALHPTPQSRQRLSTMFWGDSSEEAAKLSLRVALAGIRKALGAESILSDRITVQINPEFSLWVDVLEFQSLTGRQASFDDLQTAVALRNPPAGDLLENFFEDWVIEYRQQIDILYLRVLNLLVEGYRSQSSYPKAIELAERMLEFDPINETAHQHIMVCYEALGDLSSALKQFEICRENLEILLGIDPSQQTQSILQRIQSKKHSVYSLAPHLTNLPSPLTSFIGRESELERIENLLAPVKRGAEGVRLLTILGPGGAGKTRLAIQAAHELVDIYPDGVWWVELAVLIEPELIIQAVARAIGVKENPPQPLNETVLAHMRGKCMLIILDNCEHLIDACSVFVLQTLKVSPKLQILTTSREALGIPGENIFVAPALEIPDDDQIEIDHSKDFASVQLFLERTQLFLPEFKLTPENAPFIAKIVRQLDGLPLSIELAAARTKVFTVEQIAERLADRFSLLVSTGRGVMPRQQTLQALMDWSYDLLTSEERSAFRFLSVFPGGFSLQAAEALVGSQALHLITRLIEKSLVSSREIKGGIHYFMLETIRQYAFHRLEECGERMDAQTMAVTYYYQIFKQSDSLLELYIKADDHLERMEQEFDNIRAVLDWAFHHDLPRAFVLVGSLSSYWDLNGRFTEAKHWIDLALNEIEKKQNIPEEKIDHCSPMENMNYHIACVFAGAGTLAWNMSNFPLALQYHENSLRAFVQANHLEGQAFSLSNKGVIYSDMGDRQSANQFYRAALKIARQIENQSLILWISTNMGILYMGEGEYDRARSLFEKSLLLAQQYKSNFFVGSLLHNLADLARFNGNIEYALHQYEASQQAFMKTANWSGVAVNYWGKGMTLRRFGDFSGAISAFQKGLEIFWRIGNIRYISDCLEGIAMGLSEKSIRGHENDLGDLEKSVILFSASNALRKSIGYQQPIDYDYYDARRIMDELTVCLLEHNFHSLWQKGSNLPLDDAVQAGLGVEMPK